MDAARSVTAAFSLAMHTLTVTEAGTGSGTVTSSPGGINCGADCSEIYTRGTRVSLTATPATGSFFAGWSGACSGSGACTVTMDAARVATATFLTAGGSPAPPGDFDHDGRPDLLWHHQVSGALYTWLLVNGQAATGAYLTPDRFADTRWQIRGIADLNADGHSDLLWHHQKSGELYVWFMNYTVAIDGSYLTPGRLADTSWQIRGLSDFNGDGRADLLWHNQKTGSLYVWLMSGTTAADGSYLTPSRFADTSWQIRGLSDFNGDGQGDILWHHQKTGSLYVWFMHGTVAASGSYLSPSRFADTRWRIARVADFDDDGEGDILWYNTRTGELYVWYMTGTTVVSGSFLTPGRMADTGWQLAPLQP